MREVIEASVPTPEKRSAVRQNGRCSGDLRDGRQQRAPIELRALVKTKQTTLRQPASYIVSSMNEGKLALRGR